MGNLPVKELINNYENKQLSLATLNTEDGKSYSLCISTEIVEKNAPEQARNIIHDIKSPDILNVAECDISNKYNKTANSNDAETITCDVDFLNFNMTEASPLEASSQPGVIVNENDEGECDSNNDDSDCNDADVEYLVLDKLIGSRFNDKTQKYEFLLKPKRCTSNNTMWNPIGNAEDFNISLLEHGRLFIEDPRLSRKKPRRRTSVLQDKLLSEVNIPSSELNNISEMPYHPQNIMSDLPNSDMDKQFEKPHENYLCVGSNETTLEIDIDTLTPNLNELVSVFPSFTQESIKMSPLSINQPKKRNRAGRPKKNNKVESIENDCKTSDKSSEIEQLPLKHKRIEDLKREDRKDESGKKRRKPRKKIERPSIKTSLPLDIILVDTLKEIAEVSKHVEVKESVLKIKENRKRDSKEIADENSHPISTKRGRYNRKKKEGELKVTDLNKNIVPTRKRRTKREREKNAETNLVNKVEEDSISDATKQVDPISENCEDKSIVLVPEKQESELVNDVKYVPNEIIENGCNEPNASPAQNLLDVVQIASDEKKSRKEEGDLLNVEVSVFQKTSYAKESRKEKKNNSRRKERKNNSKREENGRKDTLVDRSVSDFIDISNEQALQSSEQPIERTKKARKSRKERKEKVDRAKKENRVDKRAIESTEERKDEAKKSRKDGKEKIDGVEKVNHSVKSVDREERPVGRSKKTETGRKKHEGSKSRSRTSSSSKEKSHRSKYSSKSRKDLPDRTKDVPKETSSCEQRLNGGENKDISETELPRANLLDHRKDASEITSLQKQPLKEGVNGLETFPREHLTDQSEDALKTTSSREWLSNGIENESSNADQSENILKTMPILEPLCIINVDEKETLSYASEDAPRTMPSLEPLHDENKDELGTVSREPPCQGEDVLKTTQFASENEVERRTSSPEDLVGEDAAPSHELLRIRNVSELKIETDEHSADRREGTSSCEELPSNGDERRRSSHEHAPDGSENIAETTSCENKNELETSTREDLANGGENLAKSSLHEARCDGSENESRKSSRDYSSDERNEMRKKEKKKRNEPKEMEEKCDEVMENEESIESILKDKCCFDSVKFGNAENMCHHLNPIVLVSRLDFL